MDEPHTIKPVSAPVRGSIHPPGSKSLTNRALIVSALASGQSRLTGALDCRDTRIMIRSLHKLGLIVRHDAKQRLIDVAGCGGRPVAKSADLILGNSGTSVRFLTALCTLGHGTFRLDGNARMRERPIQDLLTALNGLGADVTCDRDTGCPPVTVHGQGLRGGATTVSGRISSQFLSALLMAAPCAANPIEIRVEGALVSQPYIHMTLGVMARFNVTVDCTEDGRYRIKPQPYRAGDYDVEPDASAASYFFAAAAITGGEVTVDGVSDYALQGDVRFVDALEQMGCQVHWNANSITVKGAPLHGIDVDMNDTSDTAQTLAAVAPFAEGPTRIRNVAHIRHKETDRINAMVTELRRAGLHVEEHSDGLTIHPGPITPSTIQTYGDDRMAMSFSLLGLKAPGIQIADPRCVSKTYPGFFADMETLCGVTG